MRYGRSCKSDRNNSERKKPVAAPFSDLSSPGGKVFKSRLLNPTLA